VISAYSKNPKGAVLSIDFITSPQIAEQNMVKFALPAALNETYDAPSVKKVVSFAAELRQAIAQAKPRPVSPVYPLVSQAIYKNVNAALTGSTSPQDALTKVQSQIQKALATF
jgi:multiple sugar transport system substrate-binding protein